MPAELPPTRAARIDPDLTALPQTPVRPIGASEDASYQRLTEPVCRCLAAKHTGPANALDDEGGVPTAPPGGTGCFGRGGRGPTGESPADALKQTVRYHTALELRNRAAADALDRFYQLANAEAGADALRHAIPVLDDLIAKAKAARAANVRFPLDEGDLERQRSQTLAQLEQLEAGSALLNIDLKRRLGLAPASANLWPGGDFGIDATALDAETSVNAALADRPELRGLRSVHTNLSADTLSVAREVLRAGNPMLGAAPPAPVRVGVARFVLNHRGPPAEALAEVEVRRKQFGELIAERERAVADETRAAVVALNAQTRRLQRARDRVDAWTAKRADAAKKREANQPGAELLEAQVTLDWHKARAEMVSEVMAWHQARVRLKAARGWLAWECLGEPKR